MHANRRFGGAGELASRETHTGRVPSTNSQRMGEDAVAYMKVLDAGAEMQDFAGDVFAKDEGVSNAKTIVSGW